MEIKNFHNIVNSNKQANNLSVKSKKISTHLGADLYSFNKDSKNTKIYSNSLNSNIKEQSNVSFKRNIFKAIKDYFTPIPIESIILQENDVTPPSDFVVDIAFGMVDVLEKAVPARNLQNIMTPSDIRKILPQLKQNNFISSDENIENGIYCADLDYQSIYSGGKENVFDIMDKAAEYANKYYNATGKDFIFALTDKDSIEGVQHAVKYFGENSEKFKHMKFIPAIKLAFAHKSPSSIVGYENSEMLILGINPYSQNLIDFVETTIQNRKQMILDFIRDVANVYPEFNYDIIEFLKQNDLNYVRDFTVSNLYWRAREYVTTKGDTAIKGITFAPDEIMEEVNDILNNLSKVYLASDKKGHSSLGTTLIKDNIANISVKNIFEKYSTHFDHSQGKAVSSSENLYEDLIDCLNKENEKPVLAVAAPIYLAQYFEKPNPQTYDNVASFLNNLQKDSNGMLLGFESESPMYSRDENLTPKIIDNFNNQMREKTNLYEVGGSLINRD